MLQRKSSRTVVVEAVESEEPFDGTVLAVADQNVSEGATTVTVPVKVSGFSGIGGFQFTVAWDPAALTFNSVGDFDHSTATTELFFFGETNFNLDNVSDGYFTYSTNRSWLPMQQSQMGKRFFL